MSLSDELANLANPTPKFRDPEDDEDEVTAAKVVTKRPSYDEEDDYEQDASILRRKASLDLSKLDAKYAGKRVSRNSLLKDDASDDDIDTDAVSALDKMMDDDDYDDDGDDDDDDMDEEDELESFNTKMSHSISSEGKPEFSFEDDGDYSKYADDDEDSDDGEEDEDDDDNAEEDEDDDEDDEEDDEETIDGNEEVLKRKTSVEDDESDIEDDVKDGGISSFSKSSLTEEVQKGQAAKSQLALWDNLLEERIKVQKVVSVINQLPQPDTWRAFSAKGGDNLEEAVREAQSVLKQLLDDLLRVQTLLLLGNQETKHVVDGSDPKANKAMLPDSEDEEITSESETEAPEETTKPEKKQTDFRQHLKRKFKMADYPELISKRHKTFSEYRNETIEKWNDKTRLASGKVKGKSFSALEQTALKQIEQILRDKERLIRRTQLNRSGRRVLGVEESVQEENKRHEEDQPTKDGASSSEYSSEVFDDSDFYHQQLRELIERKTSDINDPVAISRQWLEIQKLRTKVKRKRVDTRASKGRKIRYEVHSKLVNFMAPIDNSAWSDESRNDLFKSLFGKKTRPNHLDNRIAAER